jgi:murein tripeptide amidase MpaA
MTFLNVDEIESALIALNQAYPSLTRLIQLPNRTYKQRQSNALLIRGNAAFACRAGFVFISGVHACEWGGPDILVNLATDLLKAYVMKRGLGYGAKSFSSEEIKNVVDRTDVIVFPDVNPDGRAYSMAAPAHSDQALWRKNRNPASSGGDATRIGVDPNRNYDFLWNFPVTFSPKVATAPASTDASSPVFFGTGPFSEPESRNVQWLIDHFPNTRHFVDIHSCRGDVLYPWGDDENQTADASMSFMNSAWDGKRGIAGDKYGEFVPPARLAELQPAAAVIRDGIAAVRGETYVVEQGFSLYPTSGASDEWAFSREFTDPSRGRLNAFTIEFNKDNDFFPTWSEMELMILDVDAGLLALCTHFLPSRIAVTVCQVRRSVRDAVSRGATIWHRLFPPDLWGPYGPWGRIKRLVQTISSRRSRNPNQAP